MSLAAIAVHARAIADAAEVLAAAEAAYEAALEGFRLGSAARAAAETLLACPEEWLSRSAISARTGCQPNAVPVVVDRLRTNGVTVERRVLGGKAWYRTRVTS